MIVSLRGRKFMIAKRPSWSSGSPEDPAEVSETNAIDVVIPTIKLQAEQRRTVEK